MLADAADGAFVVNQNQNIVYWNQAAQKILGYAPNKVVGHPCYEILRGCNEKGQAVCHHRCRIMVGAAAGKAMPDYDLAACAKSGEMRWINVSILTTRSAAGQAAPLIIHLFRDATQAKQNQQLVYQMFDSIDDASPLNDSTSSTTVTTPPEHSPLTNREHEVLTLLTQGATTNKIAETLSISPATVRNHIQNILHTLQVHSRLEAVVYALRHNLID